MATFSLAVKNLDLPVWLPTPKDVILKCKENGHGPSVFIILSPDGSEAALVKYGPSLAMGEARTQNYIANIVNLDKNIIVLVPRIYYAFRYNGIGYIIMQHVDGKDYDQNDSDAIALAVNRLRSIPSPTESPGPVGGGPVTHRFFADHRSSVQYNSVNDLQEHVNNMILTLGNYSSCVDFYAEDGGNLRLCLDDIHPGNFRKTPSGQLFAVDFAKTNFLPFAFQDLAFVDGHDLAEKVGVSLGYSKSEYRGALRLAAGRLQLFNKSSHGLPDSLRQSVRSRDLLFE